MTVTIPADTPITADLSPEQIADIVDTAANLIERDGLEIGDLWPDALLRPYEPGDSCCIAGALAVVCGYRHADDVEEAFTAATGHDFDPVTDTWVDRDPHPVFAAVMAELKFGEPEHLYDWSDSAGDAEVVEALRAAASKIRAGGAA